MVDRLVARTSRRSRCLSQASSCDLSRRRARNYTASSRLQAAGLTGAMAIFEEAASLVPLPKPPQPIVIADYGASTGHNSLLPIGAAIAVLRKRTRHDHSTLVVHTDVPDNDFTAMFRTLADDPDSYLHKDAATFASAVGRSFYEQIMPSSSVNLGWSSWSIQWLSRVPSPIPDHIQVAYSADEDVRAAYARQAAHDWHEFVAFRGRELRRGGRLVVMTMAVDDDGEFGYRPMFAALLDTLDELRARRPRHRGRSSPDVCPGGRAQEGGLLRAFRAVRPFRAAPDRSPRGVRRRGQVLVPVPKSTAMKRLSARNGRPSCGRRCSRRSRPHSTAAVEDDRVGAVLRSARGGRRRARLAAAPEQMQIPLAHLVLIKRPRS